MCPWTRYTKAYLVRGEAGVGGDDMLPEAGPSQVLQCDDVLLSCAGMVEEGHSSVLAMGGRGRGALNISDMERCKFDCLTLSAFSHLWGGR